MKTAKKMWFTYLVIIFAAMHNFLIRAESEKFEEWELPFRKIIENQENVPPEKAIESGQVTHFHKIAHRHLRNLLPNQRYAPSLPPIFCQWGVPCDNLVDPA